MKIGGTDIPGTYYSHYIASSEPASEDDEEYIAMHNEYNDRKASNELSDWPTIQIPVLDEQQKRIIASKIDSDWIKGTEWAIEKYCKNPKDVEDARDNPITNMKTFIKNMPSWVLAELLQKMLKRGQIEKN